MDAMDLDSSTAAAWTRFQARLADHLTEMEEDDLLLLEVEGPFADDDAGAAPYVQFCAWGSGQLRCEAVSNRYLAPVHRLAPAAQTRLLELGFEAPTWEDEEDADSGSANYWLDAETHEGDRLAVMAVRALRDVYGVAHPAFVSGHPFGEVPGEVPATVATEAPAAVYPSEGPEHLQRLVDQALTPFFGHPPHHDEDGDIPVDCGEVTAYVSVILDRPVVRLFACLSHAVADRGRADFEVGVLNRDKPFFKFLRRGDAIFLQVDLLAWPFVPEHLRELVHRVCRDVGEIHDDLAVRLAGETGTSSCSG